MLPSRGRRQVVAAFNLTHQFTTSSSHMRSSTLSARTGLSESLWLSFLILPSQISKRTFFHSGSTRSLPSARVAESLGGGAGDGRGGRSNDGDSNSRDGLGSPSASDSWMNLTNPRQLKSHLDKFVIGQSRAKKILAVAVFNHYVRVTQNDKREKELSDRHLELQNEMLKNVEKELQPQSRTRKAAEAMERTRKLETEARAESSMRQSDGAETVPPSRELRLGKKTSDLATDEARTLAFGRRERNWLLNDQCPQHDPKGLRGSTDSTSRPRSQPSSLALGPQDVDELAEVAATAHEDVLSDYMSQAAGVKRRKDNRNAAEFSLHYFSSYPNRHDGSTSNRRSSTSLSNLDDRSRPKAKVSTGHEAADDAHFTASLPQRALRTSTGLRSEHISSRAAKAARDTEQRARRALEAVELKLSSEWGSSRLDRFAAIDGKTSSPANPSSSLTTISASSSSSSTSSSSTQPSVSAPAPAPTRPSSHSLLSDLSLESPFPPSKETTSSPLFSKSNVLIIGPSGSGKSLMLKTIASSLHVPFVHLDCTPWTASGYVGVDPTILGERLLNASGWNLEKARRGIVCIDEVDKIARRPGDSSSKDVGGEGVQQALLSILEGTVLTVQDKTGAAANASANLSASDLGLSPNTSESNLGTRSWWKSMEEQNARKSVSAGLPGTSPNGGLGNQSGTFQLDTSSILFVLCGAFVGLEKVIAERLGKEALNSGTAQTLEDAMSKVTQDKDELFALCEPQDLIKYGLIPEFCGRIPVVASLSSLSEQDLFRILTEPENSLVSQYESLLKASDIDLRFTTKALRAVASFAAKKGTGARSLRSILEDRLLEVMYSSGSSVKYALFDEKAAKGERDCLVWGRGGIHSFSSSWDDEEDPAKAPDGMGVKVAGPGIPVSGTAKPAVARLDSPPSKNQVATSVGNLPLHKTALDVIRRRSRARLTRPSRCGNLRIQVTERGGQSM